LQKELTDMQKIVLNPPLPDISGSLSLLTAMKNTHFPQTLPETETITP